MMGISKESLKAPTRKVSALTICQAQVVPTRSNKTELPYLLSCPASSHFYTADQLAAS